MGTPHLSITGISEELQTPFSALEGDQRGQRKRENGHTLPMDETLTISCLSANTVGPVAAPHKRYSVPSHRPPNLSGI